MWKSKLSSWEHIWHPVPLLMDRITLSLAFKLVNCVQKANAEKATAGEGCGWAEGEGYCGMNLRAEVLAGDVSDGLTPFVSCRKFPNKITCILSLTRDSGKKMTKRHLCVHCPIFRHDWKHYLTKAQMRNVFLLLLSTQALKECWPVMNMEQFYSTDI